MPTGTLRLHPDNYRYLVDGGRPVFLLGRYHGDFICSTFEHFTKDIGAYTDYLKDLNVNFTQVWGIMIFAGRKEAHYGVDSGGAMFMPFERTGPGRNHYGEPKYDLTKPSKAYYDKFHAFLEAAAKNCIYVEVTLFDVCGLKRGGIWYGVHDPRWNCHPFHPSNNINDVGLPEDHAVGADRFFSLKNTVLYDIQAAYVDRMLDELGGYGHVIFNICNEYNGPFDWHQAWAQRIRERRPDRLVAVNPHSAGRDLLLDGLRMADAHIVNLHPGGGETARQGTISTWSGGWGRRALAVYDASKAIISDTDGYHPKSLGADPDAEIRKWAWSCFVNGQHFIDMSHGGHDDAGLHCPPLPTLKHLLPFADRVDFVHARPCPQLIREHNECDCLACPGREYVVYLRFGGAVRLDTSHAHGPLQARWYDPRTGEWSEARQVAPSPYARFSAPSHDDWALHVRAG